MATGKADIADNSAKPAITLRQQAYRGMGDQSDHSVGGDAAILWRITRLVLKYRLRMSLAVGATIAAAVFQLMIPRFLGDAVDSALGLLNNSAIAEEVARQALFDAAMLLLAASVLRGVFTLAHNYGGEAIGHLIAFDLRLAFYGKLQSLNFSFHDKVHTGELITRGMLDLEGVRMFVNTGLLRLVLLINLIGAGAYLLLSSDLLLGVLSFSFVPFVAWRSSAARLRLRALWLALQERMGRLGQIMDENLTGIRVVRAFGAEPFEIGKYDVASDDAMAIADQRIKTRAISTSQMTFAYFISMGLVLWVGGLRVLDGGMTVGDLTVFLTFITILQQPVRQLGLLVNSRCWTWNPPSPTNRAQAPCRPPTAWSRSKMSPSPTRMPTLMKPAPRRCSTTFPSAWRGARPWASSGRPAAANPPSPICCPAITTPRAGASPWTAWISAWSPSPPCARPCASSSRTVFCSPPH